MWEFAGNFQSDTQLYSWADKLQKALEFKKALSWTSLYSKTAWKTVC